MNKIMTVLGPISPSKLGFTSMHEHVLADARYYRNRWESMGVIPDNTKISRHEKISLENIGLLKQNYYMLDDNLLVDDEEIIEKEVLEYKESGGVSFVDVSAPGMRTNIYGVKKISEKTGVNIIASTGLYVEESWPEKFHNMDIKELKEYMVNEIEVGIDHTDIKAGHIKTAINELSKRQENVLQAAARASIDTGVSVSNHPGLGIGSDGLRITHILLEEGMDAGKIIICHTDGSFGNHSIKELILHPETWMLNLDYALKLLDK
jgi:phosphotriesterase-related protein